MTVVNTLITTVGQHSVVFVVNHWRSVDLNRLAAFEVVSSSGERSENVDDGSLESGMNQILDSKLAVLAGAEEFIHGGNLAECVIEERRVVGNILLAFLMLPADLGVQTLEFNVPLVALEEFVDLVAVAAALGGTTTSLSKGGSDDIFVEFGSRYLNAVEDDLRKILLGVTDSFVADTAVSATMEAVARAIRMTGVAALLDENHFLFLFYLFVKKESTFNMVEQDFNSSRTPVNNSGRTPVNL